tara:strand:+ start:252 stop:650 length:399 start_codon:yes stop_codon:yes gene_type:complete
MRELSADFILATYKKSDLVNAYVKMIEAQVKEKDNTQEYLQDYLQEKYALERINAERYYSVFYAAVFGDGEPVLEDKKYSEAVDAYHKLFDFLKTSKEISSLPSWVMDAFSEKLSILRDSLPALNKSIKKKI